MTNLALKSTDVRSRVEPVLKERTTDVLAQSGLPFEVKILNAQTITAITEARGMTKARFKSAQAMFDDLEKTIAKKRVDLLSSTVYAQAFRKDWQRLSRSGHYDIRVPVAGSIDFAREQWRNENATAIAAYNERVKRDGVFGDKVRTF